MHDAIAPRLGPAVGQAQQQRQPLLDEQLHAAAAQRAALRSRGGPLVAHIVLGAQARHELRRHAPVVCSLDLEPRCHIGRELLHPASITQLWGVCKTAVRATFLPSLAYLHPALERRARVERTARRTAAAAEVLGATHLLWRGAW
jgi:hypothetical protein